MTTVALGEIVDFYSGGTPSKTSDRFWRGDIPWISAKDMKHARLTRSIDHVSDEVFSSTSLRKLPPGTVVMVVRGMILAHTIPIAILEIEAAINQDLKALLPRGGVVPAYLAGMLRAQHAAILAQVSTAAHGTKKLDSRVLEQIRIPLPSIEEQRRIADILDRADALRAKRREALALLDDLAQSIFLDMFGGQLSTSSIGEICEVQSGLQVTAKRASLSIERPYLRVANVHRGRLDLTEIKTIRLTESELGRTQLGKGDVLVVEGHGNPSEIGRAAMWTGEIAECVHQNHLIRVRVDDRVMLPVFATSWLNSVRGRRHLLRAANTTSGLNTISTSDVKATPIPVPPIAAQRDFAHALEKRAAVANSMHLSSETTTDLFESLQQRAFAGLL